MICIWKMHSNSSEKKTIVVCLGVCRSVEFNEDKTEVEEIWSRSNWMAKKRLLNCVEWYFRNQFFVSFLLSLSPLVCFVVKKEIVLGKSKKILEWYQVICTAVSIRIYYTRCMTMHTTYICDVRSYTNEQHSTHLHTHTRAERLNEYRR